MLETERYPQGEWTIVKEQLLSDKREGFWEEVPVSLSAADKQDLDKLKEEKMTYHYKGREREVWRQER